MRNAERKRHATRGSRRRGRLTASLLTAGAAIAWTYAPFAAPAPGGGIHLHGVQPNYGASSDKGGGLGGAGVAAGALGVGALAAAAGGLLGAAGGAVAAGAAFAIGSAVEVRERRPPLPDGHLAVKAARMFPEQTTLSPGLCRAFSLEVQSATDGKWYSVSYRDETTFEIDGAPEGVMMQENAKNLFCLPVTAPQNVNGRSVVLQARFAPPGGGQPVTATARILLRVSGVGGPTLPGLGAP